MPAKRRKTKRPGRSGAGADRPGEERRTYVFVETRLADDARPSSGAAELSALRPGGKGRGRAKRLRLFIAPAGTSVEGGASAAKALTKSQLARAVPLDEAERELETFVGGAAVVTRDARALRASFPGVFARREPVDLAEIARAARPELRGFAPSDLAELAAPAGDEDGKLARPPRARGRSASREADVTLMVWDRLREDLARLPPSVLAAASWLLGLTGGALLETLREAEAAALRCARDGGTEPVEGAAPAAGVDERSYRELFPDRGEALKAARAKRILGEPAPLDGELVERILGAEGAVADSLESYEDRPEQREMALEVARAISAGRHLLVEGGTGVGKSLAYLVPAVLWSTRCGRPVVVATYTKNLQSQLFEKDLPLLRDALAGKAEFKAAVIKGRRNYLCLRKLFYLLHAADWDLDEAERAGLVPVVTWAPRTATGDLSEVNALHDIAPPSAPPGQGLRGGSGTSRRDRASLMDKLTTSGEECMGKRCPAFGQCFLQAARAESLAANVVVANHALVFAELGLDTPVLPEYEEIVFDEAQHVEDVATEHLAVRAARLPVMRVLSRLFRAGRGASGAGTGLLATAFGAISEAELELAPGVASSAREAASRAVELVRPVSDAADELFSAAAELLPRTGDRRRYRADGRRSARWRLVFDLAAALEGKLLEFAGAVDALAEVLAAPEAKGVRSRRELAQDLRAQAQSLKERAQDVAFVLAAEAENYVYWMEEDAAPSRRGRFASLSAAPVRVAELLKQQLVDRKRTVICTSATLSVAGRFDYLAGRLGFDLSPPGVTGEPTEMEEPSETEERKVTTALAVGSPFDFARQARAFVPSFLPDPRDEASYVEGLAKLMVKLFAATRGRGLALFTSYSMLNAARDIAAPGLASRKIRLLAQGRRGSPQAGGSHAGGSREAMLATLQDAVGNDERAVLFGTSSFWEGIDVPGEALSALVVARLPFHVFTEPIVQARCEALREAGEDPFRAYTLPAAVLRLRQGTGRLIRTKGDRGIVVIADPRVIRASYGRAFLESLPMPVERAPSEAALVRSAKAFLDGKSEGGRRRRGEVGGEGRAVSGKAPRSRKRPVPAAPSRAAPAPLAEEPTPPGEEFPAGDDGSRPDEEYSDPGDETGEQSPFLD